MSDTNEPLAIGGHKVNNLRCARRDCGWIGPEPELRKVKAGCSTQMRCPRCDGGAFFHAKLGEKEKLKTGAQLIALERRRQERIEGYTAERDDGYTCDELLKAALAYAMHEVNDAAYSQAAADEWPWCPESFKAGTDPVRNLSKAGALIAAEIDRLQRASAKMNH